MVSQGCPEQAWHRVMMSHACSLSLRTPHRHTTGECVGIQLSSSNVPRIILHDQHHPYHHRVRPAAALEPPHPTRAKDGPDHIWFKFGAKGAGKFFLACGEVNCSFLPMCVYSK